MITDTTKAAMKSTIQAKHLAYAHEAREAEQSADWTSAAQLWTLAAESTRFYALVRHYEAQAKRCNREIDVDERLGDIARRVLSIETLETRKSDRLDLHEVAVWSVKEALRTAYNDGRGDRSFRTQTGSKNMLATELETGLRVMVQDVDFWMVPFELMILEIRGGMIRGDVLPEIQEALGDDVIASQEWISRDCVTEVL